MRVRVCVTRVVPGCHAVCVQVSIESDEGTVLVPFVCTAWGPVSMSMFLVWVDVASLAAVDLAVLGMTRRTKVLKTVPCSRAHVAPPSWSRTASAPRTRGSCCRVHDGCRFGAC